MSLAQTYVISFEVNSQNKFSFLDLGLEFPCFSSHFPVFSGR